MTELLVKELISHTLLVIGAVAVLASTADFWVALAGISAMVTAFFLEGER